MIVRRADVAAVEQGEGDQRIRSLRLSDAGGLSQFGTHLHTLDPGCRSAYAHWHTAEDEMIHVLVGEATVVEGGVASVLLPGDTACWPRNIPIAHHVENRSEAACTYLVVGTRVPEGSIHYPHLGRIVNFQGPDWEMHDTNGALIKRGRVEQD